MKTKANPDTQEMLPLGKASSCKKADIEIEVKKEGDEGEEEGDEKEEVEKAAAPAVPTEPPADEDDEEDDDEEGDEAEKSDLTESDLIKSLDKLSRMATSASPVARKDELLKKAQSEDLNKSEQAELFGLLGGETVTPCETMSKSISATFHENEVLAKATDVSDYLDENQKALIKSLTTISDAFQKSETRQHEFNLVLAKAVSGVGKLVKSMSDRIGAIESQPARGPKSIGTKPGQVLHKGFAGQPAQGDTLGHVQILNGLDTLMEKSMKEGRSGYSVEGEDLSIATAKYEQTREISPKLLAEIGRISRG